jgi:hypothetical protein
MHPTKLALILTATAGLFSFSGCASRDCCRRAPSSKSVHALPKHERHFNLLTQNFEPPSPYGSFSHDTHNNPQH